MTILFTSEFKEAIKISLNHKQGWTLTFESTRPRSWQNFKINCCTNSALQLLTMYSTLEKIYLKEDRILE